MSLTEAAAEDFHRPDDERLEARRATLKVLRDFVAETGWQPQRALPIAGAMDDSSSRSFGRMLLRTLLPRDLAEEATRGVVFTNWIALNAVVDGLVREAVERSKILPPPTEAPAFRSAVEGAVLAP